MKKAACLLLCAVVLCGLFSANAAAASYSSEISSVLSEFSSNNEKCSGAPQQPVKGR